MSGNALFQSGTSIAILIGMILGGAVISHSARQSYLDQPDGRDHCHSWVISPVDLFLKQQVTSPDLKIDWNFFRTSFQTLKLCQKPPLIFTILLGNSWYWFYGATYLTQIPQLTQQNLHASENVVSLITDLLFCGYWCRFTAVS